ncbi:SDR family oxidoreductase [Sphingomonas montanisoli]|uniref:SDR family oxidoreductase n=1 Tax=Sphingomonas montanisoli TaxID=2606412 RepID=A0A5D9CEW4_9SPHN|nr:SDR family oxidoreductase [Sphingomonas montanisoli]TZG29540.1 SDR family oxidoreductase [Sphingomonas montanisoli]
MSFEGKVAIVTGVKPGNIGQAIADALVAKGAKIAVGATKDESGKAAVAAIEAAGGEATYGIVDIASLESCTALAALAAERFGRIDYLVNNAALFGGMSMQSLLDIDWDELKRLMDINLLGSLAMTRAAVPYMEKAGGGAIVNVSSSAAWMAGGHYSAAKLGLNSIALSLSKQLGPRNIRINTLAPGMTDTPAFRGQTPQEYVDMLIGNQAVKRIGTPEDQAKAVLFLLSDDASFITGSVMSCDGGLTARV